MALTIVDSNDLLTGPIRSLAERRVWFALSRFETKIRKITVVFKAENGPRGGFKDENGPRGGMDKICRITVKLANRRDVVVTDRDADLGVCVARAAERAGRAVARAVDRSRAFDRPGKKDLD